MGEIDVARGEKSESRTVELLANGTSRRQNRGVLRARLLRRTSVARGLVDCLVDHLGCGLVAGGGNGDFGDGRAGGKAEHLLSMSVFIGVLYLIYPTRPHLYYLTAGPIVSKGDHRQT